MQRRFNQYIYILQEGKQYNPNEIRNNIKPGLSVIIVEKANQKTGILTKGIVKNILTSKPYHTRGIKVRLETGQVGRVQCIIGMQKCDHLKYQSKLEIKK